MEQQECNMHEIAENMDMMDKYELASQFDIVFDQNDNIKLCGREQCKTLITLLGKAFPGKSFGRLEYGMLNTAACIEAKHILEQHRIPLNANIAQ